MRRTLRVLAALTLAACGGEDGAAPAVQASCDERARADICVDYGGANAVDLAGLERACADELWARSPCPPEGRVGTCTYTDSRTGTFTVFARAYAPGDWIAFCTFFGGTWRVG